MSSTARWRWAFLGLTALVLTMEVTFAAIGALLLWLPIHFWVRYHRKPTIQVGETPVVTAKIRCESKQESGEGDNRQTVVTFAPDYSDGRNKEWSLATPNLSLSMTLKGDVADRFVEGAAYTLQFVEGDDTTDDTAEDTATR